MSCVLLFWVSGCQRELELPAEPVRPVVVNPGVECLTHDDCVYGLCGADRKCDPSRCIEDSDCASGGCGSSGFCAYRECGEDADCGPASICIDAADKDRVCTVGCRDDEGCPDGRVCIGGGSPTAQGICSLDSADCADAPPLHGDPAALRMTDNLAAAVAFVRAREPGAVLLRAGGYGVQADGTVDITNAQDFTSRWTYSFQVGDGQTTPQRFASVLYYVGASAACGVYDPDDTGVTSGAPVPEDTWPHWQDASALVADFSSGAGCAPLAGTSSDYVLYDHTDGAPRVLVGNWEGDFGIANAVSGDFSLLDCE